MKLKSTNSRQSHSIRGDGCVLREAYKSWRPVLGEGARPTRRNYGARGLDLSASSASPSVNTHGHSNLASFVLCPAEQFPRYSPTCMESLLLGSAYLASGVIGSLSDHLHSPPKRADPLASDTLLEFPLPAVRQLVSSRVTQLMGYHMLKFGL